MDFIWQRWRNPLSGLLQRFRAPGLDGEAAARRIAWRRDPLSHPALQAMSQRDLGDLPFDPRVVADD
ncbi:hypothetical protein HBA54_20675 [Pelagibius litoralis]|uniref:Uncharacterized protein n=1 Tax=Pelagibius litoralis TaxID=374515 RepID=A0A967F0Z2_9PROT|nr:hypothetical protein [Pelagibius litoralis]NIA71018.1 hypothetical protein [Pelagibius litoralis]